MSRIVIVLLLVAISLTSRATLGVPEPTVSLKEAFDHAVARTETLKVEEKRLQQTEERIEQAEGAILPTISLMGNYQRQAPPSDTGNAFNRPDQYNARLNITQPLFRGLREFSEWRAADHLRDSQSALREQTKLTLYSQVSVAFYQILQAEKDLEDLTTLKDLTDQRVKELRDRVRIGRSRKGELLTSQAQAATLLAQTEAAIGQIEQARENFAALTGLPFETKLHEPEIAMPTLKDSLEAFMKRIEQRPDILAQKSLEQAAEERINTARGGHLPSLDFSGNYYFKRTGILEQVPWDVNLSLTIPLFQGGVVSAQVREAHERKNEQTLLLEQLRRSATREIRSLYASLSRSITRYEALKSAHITAEENYKEQTKDYRFGLVTNLDVIQALDTLQEAKRQMDRVYYESKQTESALLAAVGTIP